MFTVVTIFKKPYFTAINSRAQLCQSGRQSALSVFLLRHAFDRLMMYRLGSQQI